MCPVGSAKFVQLTRKPAFVPRVAMDGPSLIEWMGMSQEEFSRRFKGSAVKRTKRRGLLRNVAVALGDWGSPEAVPTLALALNDEEPLVRGHSAWALGRIAAWGGCSAADLAGTEQAVRESLVAEDDPWVRDEVSLALGGGREATGTRARPSSSSPSRWNRPG